MRGYEDSKVPRLFQLMEERNIKATELSRATGITTGSITDWKRGKSVPSGQRLIALTSYFGVTADYLLGTDVTIDCKMPKPDFLVNCENTQILTEVSKLSEAQKKHLMQYIKFMQTQSAE